MAVARIASIGNMAALLLPNGFMEQLGVKVGDEVDVAVIDDALVVRRTEEADQIARIDPIIDRLFAERGEVYEALAKGVE